MPKKRKAIPASGSELAYEVMLRQYQHKALRHMRLDARYGNFSYPTEYFINRAIETEIDTVWHELYRERPTRYDEEKEVRYNSFWFRERQPPQHDHQCLWTGPYNFNSAIFFTFFVGGSRRAHAIVERDGISLYFREMDTVRDRLDNAFRDLGIYLPVINKRNGTYYIGNDVMFSGVRLEYDGDITSSAVASEFCGSNLRLQDFHAANPITFTKQQRKDIAAINSVIINTNPDHELHRDLTSAGYNMENNVEPDERRRSVRFMEAPDQWGFYRVATYNKLGYPWGKSAATNQNHQALIKQFAKDLI